MAKTTTKVPHWRKRLDMAKQMNVCPTCSRHRETGRKVSLAQPKAVAEKPAPKPKAQTKAAPKPKSKARKAAERAIVAAEVNDTINEASEALEVPTAVKA